MFEISKKVVSLQYQTRQFHGSATGIGSESSLLRKKAKSAGFQTSA